MPSGVGRIWGMEKEGGRKLTIVLCEAQGGATPYTCYAGTMACKMLILAGNNKNLRNVSGGENNTRGGGRMTPPP